MSVATLRLAKPLCGREEVREWGLDMLLKLGEPILIGESESGGLEYASGVEGMEGGRVRASCP